MKANAPILQKYPTIVMWPLAAIVSALLGSCTTPTKPAARPAPIRPAPIRPAPITSPRPIAPLLPSSADAHDWRDAAITAGDWRWSTEGTLSVSRYGKATESQLILSCNRSTSMLQFSRKMVATTTSNPGQMTIRTATQMRNIAAKTNVELNALTITLPASDSIWDAMALSRGRFAVTTQGQTPIYAPSWPEVARVIEDCR